MNDVPARGVAGPAHYKLLERIGEGGLGDVYRARDTKLGRTVAVKFPPPDLTADAERRETLLHRARAVSRLSHPSIATLFDFGEDGDRVYLVFEYIPGDPLRVLISGHPLNSRRAVDFGIQLADALAEAHADGLVHGDVRPETIIVTPKERAKLLDFGLSAFTRGGIARGAAATDDRSEHRRAVSPYQSPEEASDGQADFDSDIFGLGCVLFEMLTGRQAFKAPGVAAAPVPSSIIRAVPVEIDAVIARLLDPNPTGRYQSAATLAADLRSVAAILDVRTAAQEAALVEEDTPGRLGRVVRWLVVLAVIGGAAAGLWAWRDQARSIWRRWFGPPPPAVLIVVPFDVEVPTQALVADGIADDLMTRLGTKGVRVLGRSSLRARRGQDPQEAARDAGAAVALAGSVSAAGDTVDLVGTLLEAESGAEIWSRRFTMSKAQLFANEEAIADAVAARLGLAADAGAAQARAEARVVDADAVDRYLEGRDAEARGDLTAAVAAYEQAVAGDPGFTQAYAALAAAYYREWVASARLEDAESWERLRRLAATTMAADPDLPAAHLAAAYAASSVRDAVAALGHAIRLDPSSGGLYAELARQIDAFDPERASGLYRWALELDPRRQDAVAALASLEVSRTGGAPAGDLRVTSRQDPSGPGQRLLWVQALAAADRASTALDEATRLADEYPGFCDARAARAGLLRDAGHADEARRTADEILAAAAAPDAPAWRARCAAMAAAALGDADAAGSWLRRIAADEAMLHQWTLLRDGVSGHRALVHDWYPWTNVSAHPAVEAGTEALEVAYEDVRREIGPLLPGPTGP